MTWLMYRLIKFQMTRANRPRHFGEVTYYWHWWRSRNMDRKLCSNKFTWCFPKQYSIIIQMIFRRYCSRAFYLALANQMWLNLPVRDGAISVCNFEYRNCSSRDKNRCNIKFYEMKRVIMPVKRRVIFYVGVMTFPFDSLCNDSLFANS
jgi:hypothetical protein